MVLSKFSDIIFSPVVTLIYNELDSVCREK